RKSICFEEKGTLTLTVAVCGFYELYFNGQKITKGRLAPYISNPDHIIYADSYTVEADKGENVIGLHLGNGFVNDPAGHPWKFHMAKFRSAPSFSLLGEFIGESENKIEFDAEGFRTHPSPIIFDEFRLGERYDARLEIDGWCDKDFDDSDWSRPIKAETPRGDIKYCSAEPILAERELKPSKIRRSKNGWIYEFPENRSGVCRLCVKGKRGQEISLRHSDKLKPDGELELLMGVWFPEKFERDEPFVHRDIYTCKGDGVETYVPTFTYHGFCWVEVTGITEEQATDELLTFIILNSALETSGGFETDNPEIAHLQYITRQSDLSNFFYFPTDCPQREKQGWLSDAGISSEQMLLNFHTEKSIREWYKNIAKAQGIKGNPSPITPTADWGYNWVPFVVGDSSLATLPYQLLRYRGDVEFAKEAVPTILRYLDCITSRYENGKLKITWAPEIPSYGLSDGIEHFCSGELLDLAEYYSISIYSERIFDALSLPHHKAFARAISEDIRNMYRSHIDFETFTVETESQTAQALALYHGIFNEDEWQKGFERLVEFIHRDGDRIGGATCGLLKMFHVLAMGGEIDLALKLMLTRDAPSFAIFVDEANTFWERYCVKEGDTTTHNHHYYGDVSALFIKRIAGLDYNPDANDTRRLDLIPSFPASMNCAKAYYDTVHGRIEADWRRVDERIEYTASAPDGFEIKLKLPHGYKLENKNKNTYIIVKNRG
ncbi:MAG: family 78 glycoside hydrolase catalytic domain, partial [Clostridia bacterium]|nr:family 78 glycoside hydrolase catalytic domain [Clostridia bacterium]